MEQEQHVSSKYKNFQEFLDKEQYTEKSIKSYEKVFGENFVSPGGIDSTKLVTQHLKITPGQRILDVGCGIGGSAFYFANEFGASVHGIDLSSNMINIANKKKEKMAIKNVTFDITDCTTAEFEDESFDVIYSREVILHIKEKKALFQSFYKWLKPGGHILITDYCCTEKKWTNEFTSYVKSRGYFLQTVSLYAQQLKEVGFKIIEQVDNTEKFIYFLEKELERIELIRKEEENEAFSEEIYQYRRKGWSEKIQRAKDNLQTWGLVFASK